MPVWLVLGVQSRASVIGVNCCDPGLPAAPPQALTRANTSKIGKPTLNSRRRRVVYCACAFRRGNPLRLPCRGVGTRNASKSDRINSSFVNNAFLLDIFGFDVTLPLKGGVGVGATSPA